MKLSPRMKAYWTIERLLYEATTDENEDEKVVRDLEDLFLEIENSLSMEERAVVKKYVTSKYTTQIIVSENKPEKIEAKIWYEPSED